MSDRLVQPSVVKELVRRHGFTLKKGYGQNFLIDESVLQDIVEAAVSDDGVAGRPKMALEVGPGVGTLTTALIDGGFDSVVAIEKDRQLLPLLEETLHDYPQARIVAGDALEMDIRPLLPDGAVSLRFVANLPYYVTTPILMRMLESELPFERYVVMVQREVGERMVAPPGGKDYGALSVAVQYYTQPAYIRTVSSGCFLPNPTVDSAVVLLRTRQEPILPDVDRTVLFRIVRAAFGQRRKTLLNALSSEYSMYSKSDVNGWLVAAGIDGGRRGETLSLPEFGQIARNLPAQHTR